MCGKWGSENECVKVESGGAREEGGVGGEEIGDTVRVVSISQNRMVVKGRIEHYSSEFGEQVIAEEVDGALQEAARIQKAEIVELDVAPEVQPESGLPYHEWFIEFSNKPESLNGFAQELDQLLQNKNSYYKDLLEGKILQTLKIIEVEQNGFIRDMKSQGKLGGQNKVPRLSNDRKLADKLLVFTSGA